MTANNNLDPSQIPNHEVQTHNISECVRDALRTYFEDMGDHEVSELYELVISQVEKPLLEVVLEQTRGNMTKASKVLGLNRGTLRTRMKKYGLS